MNIIFNTKHLISLQYRQRIAYVTDVLCCIVRRLFFRCVRNTDNESAIERNHPRMPNNKSGYNINLPQKEKRNP